MKRIGFLVSENYESSIKEASSFTEEFALLAPYFEQQGVEFIKVVWSSKVDFGRFDVLVPKAVWDYYDRPEEFREFLNHIQSLSVAMINPLSVIKWNMDKGYLEDIKKSGLPVLDFKIFLKGSKVELAREELFKDFSRIIVKPSIGGGSKDTAVIDRDLIGELQPLADKILEESSLVVQPFYEEVTSGEYSFFFFGGEFSYAIIKIPAKGDFRAHSFFKAENLAYTPTSDEIEDAHKFLSCSPDECKYARVDLIRVKDRLHLVELELIEPYLYFELAPGLESSASQFVRAVIS